MSINPYEAPAYCAEDHGLARSPANRVAQIGFALSLTGVLGVVLAGPSTLLGPIGIILARICVLAAFLSLPGLLASVLGLYGSPRKYAIRGLILGVLGSLFLPTFSLGFQRSSPRGCSSKNFQMVSWMFSFVAHTCPDPATSTYDEPIVARQFADLHRLMRETAVTVRRSKIRGERAPDDDDNAEYPQLDFRTMETRLAYEFPWRP